MQDTEDKSGDNVDVDPEPLLKPKKPRSQAQLAAFELARQKRLEKIAAKKELDDENKAIAALAKRNKIKIKEQPEPESSESEEEPPPKVVKKPKKKKKKQPIIHYESSSESESSSSEEDQYVLKRVPRNTKKSKPRKHIQPEYEEDEQSINSGLANIFFV